MSDIRKYIELIESCERELFSEDVTKDKIKRETAYEIVEQLYKELTENGLTRFTYITRNHKYQFTIDSKTLGVNQLLNNKNISISSHEYSVAANARGSYRSATRDIIVYLPKILSNELKNKLNEENPDISSSSYLIHKIANSLYSGKQSSTLFHEIVHAYDDLVDKWFSHAHKMKVGNDSNSYGDYMNSAVELSPRTAQIIHDFENLMRHSASNRMIMRDKLGKSFNKWINFNNEKNETFIRMTKHLNDKNKKRLYSRLYQYWEAYKRGENRIEKAIKKIGTAKTHKKSRLLSSNTNYHSDYSLDNDTLRINLYEDNQLISHSEGVADYNEVMSEIVHDLMEEKGIKFDNELYIEYNEYVVKNEVTIDGIFYAMIDFAINNGLDIITTSFMEDDENERNQGLMKHNFKTYTNSEGDTLYYYMNI